MVNSESASNFDGRGQSYFIHGNLALNSTNSCQISLLLIWTNEHKFFFFSMNINFKFSLDVFSLGKKC